MDYTQCNGGVRGFQLPTSAITNQKARRVILLLFGVCVLAGVYQCIDNYLLTERKVHMLEHELQNINANLLSVMHQIKDGGATYVGDHKVPPSAVGQVPSGQIEDVVRRLTDKIHKDILINSRETHDLRIQLESLHAVAVAGELDHIKALPLRMDYAQESVGGSIYSIGKTVSSGGFIQYYLGARSSNAPIRIIQPTSSVGECFGFFGNVGEVTIRLQQFVFVDAVSIDHIDATMSPSGNINSAPKQFNVYGVQVSNGRQHFFGKYDYKININKRLQTFQIPESLQSKVSFAYVQFRFMDNHGNSDYTCVYQTRVHGKPDVSRLERN